MSNNQNWQKVAVIGAGAVATGAMLWYLLREDQAGEERPAAATSRDSSEQVLKILKEIHDSQEKMKGLMKGLTQELIQSAETTFENTYKRVQELQPADPLEKYGMSMMDFDQLLDSTQHDPRVREAISSIMGRGPSTETGGKMSDKVKNCTVKELVEIHRFMLAELQALVSAFFKLQNPGQYEMKTVTIAAQAMVGAKVEQKFGYTTEDIEASVVHLHSQLATDRDFANVNIEMQRTMSQLMGTQLLQ